MTAILQAIIVNAFFLNGHVFILIIYHNGAINKSLSVHVTA